jgi:hypothetical protein
MLRNLPRQFFPHRCPKRQSDVGQPSAETPHPAMGEENAAWFRLTRNGAEIRMLGPRRIRAVERHGSASLMGDARRVGTGDRHGATVVDVTASRSLIGATLVA